MFRSSKHTERRDPSFGNGGEKPLTAEPRPAQQPRPPRRKRRPLLRKLVFRLAVVVVFIGLCGAGAAALGVWHVARGLPDHAQLANYQPATLTRVHAGDGRVIAEFATERRLFVPIAAMPKRVVHAFLSAEDKTFYSHSGISIPDIIRAGLVNLVNMGQNRRPIGASTITQQVAKNFLLTNEVSVERKLREMLLALRIEEALSKDRILELYLNEIYLGGGAYGVAAASLRYFNKSMDDLSVAEAAFLAALPKAPNNYDPVRFPERALERRDWTIGRMLEDGAITEVEAAAARAEPLSARARNNTDGVRADYFAEEVRRELLARYGEDQLYRGGLYVRTTLEPRLQDIADRALQRGLLSYDRRHGWRGAFGKIDAGAGWEARLAAYRQAGLLPNWRLAVVLGLVDGGAEIGLADKSRGFIPFSELTWARKVLEKQRLGPVPRQAAEILAAGDVIAVEALEDSKPETPAQPAVVTVAATRAAAPARTLYGLRQIPNVGGGVVAIDPHTGRVLAMAGGWSYELSQFNRVTQAQRQPGSSFKPFVYLPALDNGFTPSSLVLDAPFVLDQGPNQAKWKPGNYSHNFYGPSPIRVGIEQSRNLMTVRLAQYIGMDKVAATAERLGIYDKLPQTLAMALGAAETTVLRETTAYAMLVNGGKRITPTLVDRIEDRNGRTIFQHDTRPCDGCAAIWNKDGVAPSVPDIRERVVDARTAYQMVSILQGVVDRGTARRIKDLGRPLAGKTGTTNDANDAWFVGFSPDLVVGVYVGFDTPRTLGPNETGSSVAVPIFRDFMAEALKGEPVIPFRMPPGVRQVRVNPTTGLLARAGDREAIWEAFKPGTEPAAEAGPVLDGGLTAPGMSVPAGETEGLY
jgi:penicillin-binding protein 1A